MIDRQPDSAPAAAEHESRGGMGGGVLTASYPPPESLRPTLVGDRWMAVTGHPIVTHVAATVLERGGNAADAGVAAGLASNVVQVDMANFGGIAPIVVRPAGSEQVYSVGGVGVWGREASIAKVRDRFGGELPLGEPVAIVPGAPGAWLTALARFGTWSFAQAVAPAIELAADGFPLDHRTAASLEIMGARFRQWATSRKVYWPDGRAPQAGERLRQPALARLLASLVDAEQGSDRVAALASARRCFYEGDIAERLVRVVRAGGGWLTVDDLAEFTTEVAEAPGRRFSGWQVHTPSTWTQGPVLLQALGIVDGLDLSEPGHNSERYLHLVVEALKLAFSERERCYGDPDHVDVELDRLLSDDHVARLRTLIGERALPNLPTMDAPRLPSTTALCVLDRDGTAFSTAPSDTLDGGPVIGGLGIVCSPRGVQSRLRDGHPNALAGGKRPCVTPAPAIALRPRPDGDAEVWPFACPGGDVIVQAMLQGFLNVAAFGMTPQQAVEAPRVAGFSYPGGFHPHPEVEGRVYAERRIGEAVRRGLAGRGHDVHVWPDFEFDAGSVCMAMDLRPPSTSGRVMAAAADPRRWAYAAGR